MFEESGVGGKILFEAWVFGLSSGKALLFFTGAIIAQAGTRGTSHPQTE